MKNLNIQEQVIYKILQLLQDRTGLKGRWYAQAAKNHIDGQLELKSDDVIKIFPIDFKKDIKPIHFPSFLQIKETEPDLIIISENIYPAIREQLRRLNLNYLDAAGNCYIKKDNWLFLIDGFKAEATTVIKKDRAFSKAGLTLLFHFLNDESYLNVTYRQMAEDYGIALGNITYIINSLKDKGFIIQLDKKKLRLNQRKQLLDEWVSAFAEKLKPLLQMGEFRFINGNEKEWEQIPITNYETQWGAEPAAKLLTGYLKPGKLTLYTTEAKLALIKKYRLVPQEGGVLQVFRKFWKFNWNHSDIVPPILVYADLINSGDPRNIETAKKLYDGFLKDQF